VIVVISQNSRTDKSRQERTPRREVIVACPSAVDDAPASGRRSRGGPRFHGTDNVFRTGRICTGTHSFPDDADRVPDAFFESFFSRTGDTAGGKSRRHPEDVGELWAELDGQLEFPCDDLIPRLTVADAIRLGA
jgi:hypothetical protein